MRTTVTSPVTGTVTHVGVGPGETVAAGKVLLHVEAMKMEHPVTAPIDADVVDVAVVVGQTVAAGEAVVHLHAGTAGTAPAATSDAGPAGRRADLDALHTRRAKLDDSARPEAVARRHAGGHRTARENVADLLDAGSFVEYGALAIAAQRGRRSVDELETETPADGLITGVGTIAADAFTADRSTVAVAAYDYTVLAGTQGALNHRKKDRLFELAHRHRWPVVLFAEGGGGRPGDVDVPGASYLDARAFALFARLSGHVPTVAIVNGRCFAGNAALAGCADVLIATEGSNLGMAGPAMIEGAGLGRFAPEAIGPIEVQRANGVVDVVVADEAEAVAVARRYLGYWQGRSSTWTCTDQEALRHVVPENRKRTYDVRSLVTTLSDSDSVLELGRDHAPGVLTALARIEGRAVGLLANVPTHLGGAIDALAADKATRFLRLCDSYRLPIVVLCDTPGFMVGPEAERDGGVRRFSRMFVAGAALTVPIVAVVTRKAYGLGAQAMFGGHLQVPVLTVGWPTSELGPMGLEGAVRLGFRRELEAAGSDEERAALEEQMIALAYEGARGLNVASYGEIDDVIDPADTRGVLARTLAAAPVRTARPPVDTW